MINPNAVIFWVATSAITFGITANTQSAVLAFGIAMAISLMFTLLPSK